MKKFKDYIALFFLSILFIMIFKYSPLVKSSVIASIDLWFRNLVTSMFPLYIMVDLLINYGLMDLLYKLFRSNSFFLFVIAMLLGTPSNAKYIKEFYQGGFIDKNTANFMLMYSYSPNPLFILGIAPTLMDGVKVLAYLYFTIICIYAIFRRKFKPSTLVSIEFKRVSFSQCIASSIKKSFNILILVLGIVVIFGILNEFLNILGIDSIFISSILELTNALKIINESSSGLLWMMFAVSFGGLSIHTQIKSILEDTDLSYKYFLIGRLIAALPILFLICCN